MKHVKTILAAVGLASMMAFSAVAAPAYEVLTEPTEPTADNGVSYGYETSDEGKHLGSVEGALICIAVFGALIIIPRMWFKHVDNKKETEDSELSVSAAEKRQDMESVSDIVKDTFSNKQHKITISPNKDGTVNLTIVSSVAYWANTFNSPEEAYAFLKENGLYEDGLFEE